MTSESVRSQRVVLNPVEFDRLVEACRRLPVPSISEYRVDDFVENLLLTVLDFQLTTPVVEQSMAFYKSNCQVHTMVDLELLLAEFHNDRSGNTSLALRLWGYRLWTRARMLRDLVQYFDARGIRSAAGLHDWARSTQFERDFAGRIYGLGPAVYNLMLIRQGVETIKADVHVLRFIESALGRTLSPVDTINTLTAAAQVIGLTPSQLDWRIWEYQRRLAPIPQTTKPKRSRNYSAQFPDDNFTRSLPSSASSSKAWVERTGAKLIEDITTSARARGIDPYNHAFKPGELGLTASDYGSFSDWCSESTSAAWNPHVLLKVAQWSPSGRPLRYLLLPEVERR